MKRKTVPATAELTKAQKLWLPLASGLIILGAFPPFNLIPLLFVGLVPLLYGISKAQTGKQAWRMGNLFGLVYMLGQLFFILILANRWTGNIALALIPWLACGLVGQLFYGLTGLAIFRALKLSVTTKKAFWTLLIPVVWAGVEVLRSELPFIGFPWGLLATPLWRYPILIGMARFLTVYGLSAWIVFLNLTVLAVIKKDFKEIRRYSLVSFGLLAAGLLQFNSPSPLGDELKVMCLQPGVDQAFGDPKTQEDLQADNIAFLLDEAEAKRPDLIVLPEGVDRVGDQLSPTPPFILPPDIPIIFGAQRGTNPIYQSVYSFDGHTWTHADKTRLVIFGEYVPGRNLIGFLDNFHLASGDITPGKRVDPLTIDFFKTGKTKIGALICYEGLFYDVAQAQAGNGARLLAVVSIDDWFMGSPAPEQLEAAAVFRSVETNLSTVRAASTGYTMACDNKGNILAEVPIQKRAALPVTVTVPFHPQPCWWLGIFPWMSLLISAGLFFEPILQFRWKLAKKSPQELP